MNFRFSEREEALLALGARVNDLAWKIERQDDVLDILRRHLNKLQDGNLAPMLESSAVIVELRRIADALEALTKSIDGVQEANVYGQWCIRTMPFGGDS